MKYIRLIKITLITSFIFLLALKSYPQCGGGGTNSGNLTMQPFFQTTTVSSGERYTFDAYLTNTYIFSFCQGGGNNTIDTQIEICDQTGTTVYEYNDDHCGLGSEITWTPPANGTYSVVIHRFYCNDAGTSAGTLAYKNLTPPSAQDCLGAIPLCLSSYSTSVSYSGTGNYPNEIATTGGCPGNCMLSGERNDVWYTFTVQTGGSVNFVIDPNTNSDDYDWAVYDLTNNDCMDISTITGSPSFMESCNWSADDGDTGPTGATTQDCGNAGASAFNDDLTVSPGETYVVNVSNWTSSQDGYQITFGGSATIVDNTGPYLESLVYAPECGASSITVQFSERIWCTGVDPSDFTLTGPQGTYDIQDVWSQICDAGANSTYGDTYYDDIWTFDLDDHLEHDGNYTLTVNTNGVDDICGNFTPPSSINFSITGVTASVSHTDVSCYGADDGTAQVTGISGGSPPYTITWNGPGGFTSSNASISNLVPGGYTVSVLDNTGRCEFAELITIYEPTQISFNTSVTDPTCAGNDGSITVNGITGMFSPYDIGCTGQATAFNTSSHTFNGLSNGTYTITVTDDNGCYNTSTIVLNGPDVPDASFTYNGNQCLNNQSFDFTHTGTSVPGETYNWAFSGGTPGSSTAENPTGITFGTPGTHNVTLTINGGTCIDNHSMNVTVYDVPSVSVTTTDENCGACDGTAVATSGYSSYNWSTGGTGDNINGLCTGSYDLTVTNSDGCESIEPFNIGTVGTLPNANVVTTDPSCVGSCDGTATVNATGPATFMYNYSAGSTPNNQTTGGLCDGSYSVTVSDGAHPTCYAVENFTITDPPPMVLTMSGTDANCGLSNGSAGVSVTGATMPLSYNWSNGGVTGTINNIPSGSYTVTVTDGNGCTASNSIIINDAGAPFTVSTSVNQNAQCNGSCDGSATVVASGSPGPYTYQWSSGTNPNNATVNGLCAGTHTVTVTEGSCNITETLTITEPAAITTTVSSNDAHCGQDNGNISVSASGGTVATNYSYEWDCTPQQFSATANNLPSGTYHVTVTDDNGCTAQGSGSVMDVGGVTINETHQNTSCSYNSDGQATINVLSGDPNYTYLCSNGASNNTSSSSHTFNNLAAGSYTVTVTDTYGCSAMTNFNINNAPALSASITSSDDASCNTTCDGTATGLGSGGTGSMHYDWGAGNGNTPNQAFNSGLCAGSYELTVTDDNSCSATASVVIDEPSAITITTSSTDSHCGQADGSASVVATGGTVAGDYSYQWSGGSQPNMAVNTGLSAAGSPYTVTVTDDNGCTQTASVNISDVPPASVSISSSTDITCNGDDDGTATVSIGGGDPPFSIEWGTTPVQTTNTAIDLSPGQHNVTVTDNNGCTYETNVFINEPSPLTVNNAASHNDCFGDCSGSSLATPSGGTPPYNYLWSDFQNTQTAVSLCAGDYAVTVTDANGCQKEDSVSIIQNSPIVLSDSITPSDCGQANGAIDLTVSGGSAPFSFNWDYGPHTEDISGIPAGSYEVTVIDNKGCQHVEMFSLNDVSGPAVTISSTTDVSCNGGCDGIATANVTGGTGPFSYVWNTTPNQTNQTATNLCQGTYALEVTDMATGCVATTNVTINEPTQLDASAATVNPSCNSSCDGEIQITTFDGTPPYNYTWTGPGSLPSTEDQTNLCAGTYTVVITDAMGCMITRSYTLTEPAFINASTSTGMTNCNASCDGDATVSAIGGTSPYTYLWSDINSQTSQTAVNLCPGTYGVTVTDANGCTGTAIANIPNPSQLQIVGSSVSDATCNGLADGQAGVTVNGGTPPYTYNWSDGTTTATATNLPAGTHCVTVVDNNLCSTDTCLTINEPAAISVSFNATDESCFGYCDGEITANVSGGTPGYSYIWSNTGTSATNNNLCVGMYLLTVTDANGCQVNASTSINGPPLLDVVVQDTVMPHCGNSDGSVTVGVVGGTSPYNYDWLNYPANNNAVLSNVPSGNYIVTVTDNHGCSAMTSADLNDISAPVIDSIVVNNVDCNGNNTADAHVYFTSNTASNTIQWDDTASQTSAHADNLPAGQYTVTIIDDNNCSSSQTITVTEPQTFTANINSYQDVTCYGFCNGTAQASFNGGTPPVNYSWTGGHNGENVSGLCPGYYYMTATDANGCMDIDSFMIAEPPQMTLNENITPVTCHGYSDGSISVNVSGGTGNYDYQWTGISSNNPSVSGLTSASYSIIVYNSTDHSCFVTENYFVPEPAEIDANFGTINATCNSDNGSAYIDNVSGGTPGYNYTWNPGNIINTDSATNLAPGTYTCRVQDAYGCTADFNVNVGETPAPYLDNTYTSDVTCYGYNDGYAEVNVSGGTPPYIYDWQPDYTDDSYCDTLPAGLYTVTISDQNDCNVYATLPVSGPDELVAIATGDDTLCIGQSAPISVTASGGTPPYNFNWDNLSNGANHTVSPEVSTTYMVTAVDNSGCSSVPQNVEIDVHPPLDLSVVSPGTVCFNQIAVIDASASGGDGNYVFDWGNGTVTSEPQLVYSPTQTTDFEIVLSDGCGTPEDTVNITLPVAPQPQISVTKEPGIGCAPLNVAFNNNVNNNTYSYQWNFDDPESGGENTSTIRNPNHYFENSGNYNVSLSVTTNQGCHDSVNVSMQVQSGPEAEFRAIPWTANSMSAEIHFSDLSQGATAWHWFFGDEGSSNIQNPDFIFEEKGEIPVTLIAYSNIGCTDTVTHEVNIIEEHQFYVPNAINLYSPTNNEFYPKGVGIDYDSYRLYVYDRWGELIFHTRDIDEHWKGKAKDGKGDYVPQGVYTWVITLRDKLGKSHTYSGTVTVFK